MDLDRAPSSSFARAIRGVFGDCSEGRGRCGNGFARREGGAVVEERAHCFARARARETFRKPPSRLEAQGVEADCEARGKIKNDKARGRFAGH